MSNIDTFAIRREMDLQTVDLIYGFKPGSSLSSLSVSDLLNEIDRLTESNDLLERELNDLRAEFCMLKTGHPRPTHFNHEAAISVAESRGWNCFDEKQHNK